MPCMLMLDDVSTYAPQKELGNHVKVMSEVKFEGMSESWEQPNAALFSPLSADTDSKPNIKTGEHKLNEKWDSNVKSNIIFKITST